MRLRTLAAAALAAATLPLLPIAGAPATAAAQVDPYLSAQIDRAGPSDEVEVIVHATTAAEAEGAVRAAGLPLVHAFPKVAAAATRAPAGDVADLAGAAGVTYLEGNRPVQYFGTTGPETTRIVQAEATYPAATGGGLDGTGVGIAIVDSGMRDGHPMYLDDNGDSRMVRNLKQVCAPIACNSTTPKKVDERFFVDSNGQDTDTGLGGGHGTHVTGIAAGREVTTKTGTRVRGAATNASISGIGSGAGLFVLNPGASLNWVLEHHADPCFDLIPKPTSAECPPIKVVNNSYGGISEYNPNGLYEKISDQLARENVVVVWAAGNGDELNDGGDGSDNRTNGPGASPVPGVLMVANYNDLGGANRNAALDASSSRGQKGRPETYPDLSAPGTNILNACAPGMAVCRGIYTADLDYGEISGTSMAAPLVAGIAALLFQYDPTLTAERVEDVLEDSAHRFGAPASYEEDRASTTAPSDPGVLRNDTPTSFDKGHGLVDLTAAISLLRAEADPGVPACTAADGRVVDRAGDGVPPFTEDTVTPNEPLLDIVEAAAAFDAGATSGVEDDGLALVIRVTDVRANPPTGDGVTYRWTFTTSTGAHRLDVKRPTVGAPTFTLQTTTIGADGTAATTTTTGVPVFDSSTDEIRAVVPVTATSFPAGFPETLAGSALESRTTAGPLAPRHDVAGAGRCPLVVTMPAAPVEDKPGRGRGKPDQPPGRDGDPGRGRPESPPGQPEGQGARSLWDAGRMPSLI